MLVELGKRFPQKNFKKFLQLSYYMNIINRRTDLRGKDTRVARTSGWNDQRLCANNFLDLTQCPRARGRIRCDNLRVTGYRGAAETNEGTNDGMNGRSCENWDRSLSSKMRGNSPRTGERSRNRGDCDLIRHPPRIESGAVQRLASTSGGSSCIRNRVRATEHSQNGHHSLARTLEVLSTSRATTTPHMPPSPRNPNLLSSPLALSVSAL